MLNVLVSSLLFCRAAASTGGTPVGYREFIDSLGIVWKVWNSAPLAGAVVNGESQNGSLTFESMTCCLRRLTPPPDNWDQLSLEQLEQLCTQAVEVRRPTSSGDTSESAPEPNDALRAPNERLRNH